MNGKDVKRLGIALVLGLGMCLVPGVRSTAGGKADKVELKTVKHADLVKAIAAHKGKVVLVDFWATFCAPCIEKFPKIVHLAEDHREKGLVLITVSFDEDKKHDKALDFLQKQKATFTNLRVEDPDVCQDKWDFVAIPTYLVFGRDGKLARKFTIDPDAKTQFTLEDVQKAVEKELK